MMLRNGTNKNCTHAFWTGFGMHPVDTIMMCLYYFGLSKIFQVHSIQIILYTIGIFILTKLAISCFKKPISNIESNACVRHSIKESIKDGMKVSVIPSSLITWVALYGSFLSAQPNFFVACAGILTGFVMVDIAYMLIVMVINKFSNDKIFKLVNMFGGVALLGFAIKFVINLIQLLI